MACKGSAQGARVAYLLLLAAGVVLALVLRFAFAPAMASWEGVQLVDMCEGSIECTGNEAVYRVAGTLAAFYLGLGALCACPGDVGASAHRGFWAIKLFVLSTAMVGSLWVPNGAFDAFASVSRVASVLFVLYQGLLLIDFAYMWNGKWVGLDEEADGFSWRAGILAICVALYAASFTGIGMMYSLYTGDECGFSSAVLTATLLAIVLFTGLGVSPLSPHGALLPSAIIAADCVYLAYSALSSNPVAACNPFSAPGDADGTGGHETLHLVVGLAMAGVSIAWKANSAATSVHLLHAPEAPAGTLLPITANGAAVQTSELAAASDEESAAAAADGSGEKEEPLEADAAFFHVMMAVSCMYFGTLLTDWGTASPDHGDIRQYDVGWASAWVKVGTQWSIIVMYIWTLIAPALFPDRDFGG
eukprot:CAMPEP_0119408054 /NCGR_PEP_ID=MMETSP1335-20130426/1731_1 /TAXON_ID=259385 /ORGANISM="Chrysoculter rhomboideus, Strain RCC1486" /LENGTH=417 /DNA_ID=CAMNT_0007432243 /DNA_START=122 /DNA_END=1375 /DNA_ORIENTATION=-